jgi:hypothetical protein
LAPSRGGAALAAHLEAGRRPWRGPRPRAALATLAIEVGLGTDQDALGAPAARFIDEETIVEDAPGFLKLVK